MLPTTHTIHVHVFFYNLNYPGGPNSPPPTYTRKQLDPQLPFMIRHAYFGYNYLLKLLLEFRELSDLYCNIPLLFDPQH